MRLSLTLLVAASTLVAGRLRRSPSPSGSNDLVRRAVQCASDEYASYNNCIKCINVDVNALTCSSVSAKSCSTGYVVSSGKCVTECPIRYYDVDGVCKRCSDSDAGTCNADGALSCVFKNLYNGACINTCPDAYFTAYGSHVCSPCGTNQATCDKNGALTCSKGYLSEKTCVDSCPSGTYADKTALQCISCTTIDPNAATCSLTSASGPVVKSCTNGYGLSGGACVEACPTRTYLADSGICTKCADADASACTADAATKCTFRYLTEGKCALKCPDGQSADWYSRTCIVCKDPDAATCTSAKALSCKTKFLHNGACVDACPAGQVSNTEAHTCGTCSGDGVATCDAEGATSCSSGYLYDHACSSACPAATYADEDTKTCIACDEGVKSCSATGADVCGLTSTGETLYLEDGKCVSTCKDGSYPDAGSSDESQATRLRARAGPGSGPSCLACPDGVSTCSSAPVALTCTKNAADVQTYIDASTTSCVVGESCSSLTWPSSADSNYTCAACPEGSTACDASGRATACGAPKLLSEGTCVDKCPTSTFAKDGSCSACGPSATQCISADIATACGENGNGVQIYLLNGKCALASACPSWGYISEDALACKRCDTFAVGSITCNAEGALTCGKLDGVQTYLTANRNYVGASSCPGSTWANSADNTCTACDEGTKTCSGNGAGKATECLTTSSGDAYYLDATSNTCLKTCPDYYFANSLNATCVACDDGEKICTGNGEGSAVVCAANKFLTPDKECVTAAGCAALGLFYGNANTVVAVCSVCEEGVLACTGTGAGTASKCGVKNDVQLYLDLNGNCVAAADCPLSTFVNSDDATCTRCGTAALMCNSPTDATVCGSLDGVQFYLNDGACVVAEDCTSGTGADVELDVCQDCGDMFPNSLTCTSTAATSCDGNTFLYSGSCVATCPADYSADTTEHVCVNCKSTFGPNTETCTAQDIHTCVHDTYRKDGVGSCENCGTLFGPATLTCSGAGAETCGNNTYVKAGVCTTCLEMFGAGVETCDATQILTCDANRVLIDGHCILCSVYFDEGVETCTDIVPLTCTNPAFSVVAGNICRQVMKKWDNMKTSDFTIYVDAGDDATPQCRNFLTRNHYAQVSWSGTYCSYSTDRQAPSSVAGNTMWALAGPADTCEGDPYPNCSLVWYEGGTECRYKRDGQLC